MCVTNTKSALSDAEIRQIFAAMGIPDDESRRRIRALAYEPAAPEPSTFVPRLTADTAEPLVGEAQNAELD